MAAQTYNVRFKDGTTTQVAGVQSETIVHEDQYDLSNYRNELDASYLGREWDQIAIPVPVVSPERAEGYDDRLNAKAPFQELKKRSRLKLWSGLAGAGDCLFMAWCDEIRGYSIGTFSRV